MPKITMKAARINAGLTQENAAKKMDISKKTLSRWENGISFPTPPKIEEICALYGVSYDDLIFLPTSSL